jgi:hypothetical protein
VNYVKESNLAWALIEAVKQNLSLPERNRVFIAIGAGDTFAAIRQLINLIAAKHIPLRPQLLQVCATWLDTYAVHEEHGRLRRLIEDFLMPGTFQAKRLAGHPSTRPSRVRLRAASSSLHMRSHPAAVPAACRAIQ